MLRILIILARQKSREKNVGWEETRRRTEASLARKRMNPNIAKTGDGTSGSPTTNGAMDSLLEKSRAAAPQARDQRDRRRRARLKERHQVRVASGQTDPDKSAANDQEKDAGATKADDGTGETKENSAEATSAQDGNVSESDNIADRAASMLQGLRSDKDTEASRTRRRDSAEEARRNRRMRRRNPATSGSNKSADDNALLSPVPQIHIDVKKRDSADDPAENPPATDELPADENSKQSSSSPPTSPPPAE